MVVSVYMRHEWRCPDCWIWHEEEGAAPAHVTCSGCGAEYSTAPQNAIAENAIATEKPLGYAEWLDMHGERLSRMYGGCNATNT